MSSWLEGWRWMRWWPQKAPPALAALIDESGPYKGLRPYTEADQDNFFAREADCRILIDKILANRLTLLFAASGVGKSSLLQAAVLPHLKHPKHENLDVVYHNDWVTPPLTGLKEAVLTNLKERGRIDADALPEDLATLSLTDFFAFCTLFTRPPLVVMLDQFEEFFQYQRYRQDFRPFIRELAALITDREVSVAVVIAMREDFALELNAFKPALPTLLFENFYRLEKLGKDRAKEAIAEPVEQRGYHYEDGLLDELIEDLAAREQAASPATPVAEYRDTVEPAYLQIVCAQLWNLRDRSSRLLSRKAYTQRGRAAKLLETYVGNVIGRFSPGEKKLASKAFDHLVTRRGTKMAYTADTLADTVQVNESALADVLEQLHRSFVLRRQSREGIFWYELYHDLFSGPIEDWNREYKARQRVRRTVWGGVFAIVIAATVILAYNALVNLTNYHLRLSLKEGLSDTVELYQGKAGAWDFWGLQAYIAETRIRRRQIEPDKLFADKPVGDLVDFNLEAIRLLPLVERIGAYWKAGYTQKALDLAATSISAHNMDRSRGILDELRGFRSLEVIDPLAAELNKTAGRSLKQNVVSVLTGVGISSNAAGQRLVEPLVELLRDPVRYVRGSAAEALGRLGSEAAVEPLVELLRDQDRDVRKASLVALADIGEERASDAIASVLHDKTEEHSVRLVAATALLASEMPDGLPMLENMTRSKRVSDREEVANALGAVPTAAAAAMLKRLLDDKSTSVRTQAAKSLGKIKAASVVPGLQKLLADPNIHVQRAAAEALGEIAAPESVAALREYVSEPNTVFGTRQLALEAVGKIGNNNAVAVIMDVCAEGGLIELPACKQLGEIRARQALDPLSEKLAEVGQRARKRREIRDSEQEDFSESQREDWQKQLADHRPDPIRAFELARAIARIDPDETGIELLSHDLFNARYGAWMGLGSVGTVKLLRDIHGKRRESQDPLFQYAAYRAIDHILIHLGVQGRAVDLRGLRAFYPQVKAEEGVGTRVEWTIKQLESRIE